MGWRTAIEINHDYLHLLVKQCPDLASELERILSAGDFKKLELLLGVTYLGTRHHADAATYEVK